MSAFIIFDVDIHNPERYQDFIRQVKPAIESAVPATSFEAVRTRSTKVIGLHAASC
jgi:uncharacterized protein (DUF1330 family)